MEAGGKRTVYVGGLDDQVNEEFLLSAFRPFGDVVQVQIPKDPTSPSGHRGFGFVEFEEARDAQAALDNMNLSELFGRVIKCSMAKPISIKDGSARPVWSDDQWLMENALKAVEGELPKKEVQEDANGANGEESTVKDQPVAKRPKIEIQVNPRVFLEIEIGGRPAGKMVFQLRPDIVPKTAKNFLGLCTHEKGYGYKGSIFHRVIKQFMCQGGDFTNHDGTGGKSIYGEKFEDEDFTLKHTSAGTLSMANAGPGTNASQFFVTFGKTEWLDGKHVVFGHIVTGLEVLRKMEKVGSSSGKPSQKVVIVDCGIVEFFGGGDTQETKE